MKNIQFRSHFDDLIAQSKTGQAIDELKLILYYVSYEEDFDEGTSRNLRDLLDELIMNQASFETNEREHRLRIIGEDEYNLNKSKCTNRFQALLAEIQNKKNQPILDAVENKEINTLIDSARKQEKKKKNNKSIYYYKWLLGILLTIGFIGLFFFFAFCNELITTDYYLVSSNGSGSNLSPWTNSDIQVENGDIISIQSSGLINLANHHVIHNANVDSISKAPWTNFIGYRNSQETKEIDKYRETFKIAKRGHDAALLVAISSKNPHENARFSEMEKDKGWNYDITIFQIGQQKEGALTATSAGSIWFTINDDWIPQAFFEGDNYLNPVIRKKRAEMLYPPELDKKGTKEQQDSIRKVKYDYIIHNNYSNIWYDDNAGCLLLKVSIKRKKKISFSR